MDEKEFNELIERIKGDPANQSAVAPNLQRVSDVAVVTDMMYQLDLGDNVKISNSLPNISSNLGEVNVEGASLEIFHTGVFQKAVKLANNFEVYPLQNGKIRMTFGFYGMKAE